MGVAGHGRSASNALRVKEDDPVVTVIATEYVREAGGDLRRALHAAVADGVTATRLVFVGFARCAQPAGRRPGQ